MTVVKGPLVIADIAGYTNPGGPCLLTVSLKPLRSGGSEAPRTRLAWRMRLTGGAGQRMLMLVMRRRFERMLKANFDSLVQLAGEPQTRL